MGIGVSILLIAVGAILVWGVSAEAEGLNVDAIGVVLMVVGVLGFVLSMMFWNSWFGRGARGGERRRDVYVEDRAEVRRPVADRRVVVEEEEVGGPPPAGPPPP